MTKLEETSGLAAGHEVARRWLPALLLLFVGSGCAALIYEVVLFQLLQLSIGSSAVSVAILLGIVFVGVTGFAPLQAIHDAAHNTRHAAGFPCH